MTSVTTILLLLLSLTLSLTTSALPTTSPEPQPDSEPPTQSSPSPSPSQQPLTDFLLNKSPFSTLTPILTTLGYHDLALVSQSLTLSPSTTPPFHGPITIFAPSDTSLRTCPTCSHPILLQEHSLPGLYPSSYLHSLPFGTRLETTLPGRCITLTSSSTRLFVNGAEVTSPDAYVSGHVIVHGVHGYLSHLSLYSCAAMSHILPQSPSFSLVPSIAFSRMMLADAMIRLRTSGYSILALAIRVKYAELVTLRNMTIFAVDDTAIFHGGQAYVHSVRFHVLPNRILHYADLDRLPAGTILPTLEFGESLTVTNGGGGGVISPMRINYVRIKYPDLLYNMKLVVHGISSPFPRLSHAVATSATRQVSFGSAESANHHHDSSSASDESASSSSSSVFQYHHDLIDDEGHDGL